MAMHSLHCTRNIKRCDHCKQPIPVKEYENHVVSNRGTEESVVAAISASDWTSLRNYAVHGTDMAANLASGNTPLHVAVNSDRREIISKLLDAGVSVNARNTSGNTALHLACSRSDVSASADNAGLIRFLLSRGSDVHAPNTLGDTPLQIAQRNGNFDVVMLLTAGGSSLRPV
jgi:hypothetical protein